MEAKLDGERCEHEGNNSDVFGEHGGRPCAINRQKAGVMFVRRHLDETADPDECDTAIDVWNEPFLEVEPLIVIQRSVPPRGKRNQNERDDATQPQNGCDEVNPVGERKEKRVHVYVYLFATFRCIVRIMK